MSTYKFFFIWYMPFGVLLNIVNGFSNQILTTICSQCVICYPIAVFIHFLIVSYFNDKKQKAHVKWACQQKMLDFDGLDLLGTL